MMEFERNNMVINEKIMTIFNIYLIISHKEPAPAPAPQPWFYLLNLIYFLKIFQIWLES